MKVVAKAVVMCSNEKKIIFEETVVSEAPQKDMQVTFRVGAKSSETTDSDSGGERRICPDQCRRNVADFAVITASSFPSWM